MLAERDPVLRAITQTIVERFAPERIVLFGSRARGDHHPESDYDLIVVLETELGRRERSRPIADAVRGAAVGGVDVIAYTPAEFERSRFDVGAMAYAGEAEGRVLYDRTPSRLREVREEPHWTPESLKAWLDRADSDFGAMGALLASGQSPDTICLHAHQAAEKYLKAAIIRSNVRPPRTHDLRELAGRCVPVIRDDSHVHGACALLHALWPNLRYPNDPMPTPDDARMAVTAATAVREAVMRLIGG